MNEWVIIAVIAVAVIFGASKLPQFARNVGKAQGEFKKGLKEGAVDEDTAQDAPAAQATPATPPPAPSPTPQAPTTQPAPEAAAPDAPRPAEPPTQS